MFSEQAGLFCLTIFKTGTIFHLFFLHSLMHVKNGLLRTFLWIAFIVFLLLLTKNILFKKSPYYYKRYFRNEYRHYKIKQGWEKANTKPFSTIQSFYNSHNINAEYRKNNLWGNLFGFAPLGIFLPLLISFFRKGIYVLLTGIIVSLCYETAQLVLNLGVFDVDDIILNASGCFLGYIIAWMYFRIMGGANKNASPVIAR
jgi:glycopeptide antibiotics resistance protein